MPKDVCPFVVLSYYIGQEILGGFALDLLPWEKYIMTIIQLVWWLILYVSCPGYGMPHRLVQHHLWVCLPVRVFTEEISV